MDEIEYVQIQIGKKKYPKVKLRNRNTCLKCGRKLTDPESKKRGMGLVCFKRFKYFPP